MGRVQEPTACSPYRLIAEPHPHVQPRCNVRNGKHRMLTTIQRTPYGACESASIPSSSGLGCHRTSTQANAAPLGRDRITAYRSFRIQVRHRNDNDSTSPLRPNNTKPTRFVTRVDNSAMDTPEAPIPDTNQFSGELF